MGIREWVCDALERSACQSALVNQRLVVDRSRLARVESLDSGEKRLRPVEPRVEGWYERDFLCSLCVDPFYRSWCQIIATQSSAAMTMGGNANSSMPALDLWCMVYRRGRFVKGSEARFQKECG